MRTRTLWFLHKGAPDMEHYSIHATKPTVLRWKVKSARTGELVDYYDTPTPCLFLTCFPGAARVIGDVPLGGAVRIDVVSPTPVQLDVHDQPDDGRVLRGRVGEAP